jgi:hypothetical protein
VLPIGLFEDTLLDWIVYTCQPFTVTETKWFKSMMKAGNCQHKIPGADTVSSRLYTRLAPVEIELKALLEQTCSTIALSLDGWTSQNSLPMLAINGTWLGPNFQQYRACLEFIEIKVTYSGENLATIVYRTLKRLGILQKLLTITGDNAYNNDTLCRYLYISMANLTITLKRFRSVVVICNSKARIVVYGVLHMFSTLLSKIYLMY